MRPGYSASAQLDSICLICRLTRLRPQTTISRPQSRHISVSLPRRRPGAEAAALQSNTTEISESNSDGSPQNPRRWGAFAGNLSPVQSERQRNQGEPREAQGHAPFETKQSVNASFSGMQATGSSDERPHRMTSITFQSSDALHVDSNSRWDRLPRRNRPERGEYALNTNNSARNANTEQQPLIRRVSRSMENASQAAAAGRSAENIKNAPNGFIGFRNDVPSQTPLPNRQFPRQADTTNSFPARDPGRSIYPLRNDSRPRDHERKFGERRQGLRRATQKEEQAPNENGLFPGEVMVNRNPERESHERSSKAFESQSREPERVEAETPEIARLDHEYTDPRPSRRKDREPRNKKGAGRREEKFALDDDDHQDLGEEEARKARKEQKKKEKAAQKSSGPPPIDIPPFISVVSLASVLKVRLEEFIKKLDELGFEDIAQDHVLNAENAGLVAMEYGYEPIIDRSETEDLKARPAAENKTGLPLRPPVVTIMGHVDHGKTTILDYLRKSSVAASEHGGITQHIGAFSVPLASGRVITFLDTPGHAAFLTMRQRGANVTDIVILVIAADDSIKPQTIEAIKHAKAAQVPIIVAINKIDKEEANAERVKQDLIQHDLEVEDFGGDIQAIPLSGKTGQGIPALEEAIITLAEIIDLRAEDSGPAEGWVLEATTKKAGRVATVLIKRGTLRPGDTIVAGNTWARVRALRNEAGVAITSAPPGTPVEIEGWRDQPSAGDEVLQAPSEAKATDVVAFRTQRAERQRATLDMEAINAQRRLDASRREAEHAAAQAASEAYYAQSQHTRLDVSRRQAFEASKRASERVHREYTSPKSDVATLYFVVKADVGGSAEAVTTSLDTIPIGDQPVKLDIMRSDFGQLSESDIALASAAPKGSAFIINFSQPMPPHIREMALSAGIEILDETIIYKVIDRVREAVEAALPPLISTRVLGEAVPAQLFEVKEGKKLIKIAGSKVRNGVVHKGKKVRVIREKSGAGQESECVYEGMLSSLKSHKRDVSEIRKGNDCGIRLEDFEDVQIGDVIQSIEEIREKRRLPT